MISSYSGSHDIVNAVDGNHETLLHRQVSYLSLCVHIFSLHMLNYTLQEKVRTYSSRDSIVQKKRTEIKILCFNWNLYVPLELEC